jgi:hypothetical protein
VFNTFSIFCWILAAVLFSICLGRYFTIFRFKSKLQSKK